MPKSRKFVVPVNPPDAPDESRPNAERDEREIRSWWCRPFVIGQDDQWNVRVLDGGAWDRTTWHGCFTNQAEAVDFATKLHEIYWSNTNSNELPLPFPYEQRLTPLPGLPGAMSAELIGPAALVAELKEARTNPA